MHFPLTENYDEANQYISDYTSGVSAAEESLSFSKTDPAVVELPDKRTRRRKHCDESDINSESSSCESVYTFKGLVGIQNN